MSASTQLVFSTPAWQVPGHVKALVTTRAGGVSEAPYAAMNLALHVGDAPAAVNTNRQLLAQQLHPALRWQWLEQVHGSTVVRVDNAGSPQVADGIITATAGLACCVLTADCLSVFVTDANGTEVGLAHAGWRGLLGGVVENLIGGMTAPATELHVWLGPAIGPCHFEVGAEVRDAFVTASDVYRSSFHAIPGQLKFLADLFGLARQKLVALGVAQVTGGEECTYCLHDKYYSYRRQNPTGRQLSLIYLEPAV